MLFGNLSSVRFMESPYQSIPSEQQGTRKTLPLRFIVTLIIVSACALPVALPLMGFFGPLLFERTISVSNSPLNQIPARFHPHFSPNAAHISGQYSSVTRQCTFTYSCTQADFEALIAREQIPSGNQQLLDDGSIRTGRQWGPGVVSYEFLPDLNQASVDAAAW